jgi:hypothetical protein
MRRWKTRSGEDVGKIKGGIQNLTEAAMKLGEAIYKASRPSGEATATRTVRAASTTISSMPISRIWAKTSAAADTERARGGGSETGRPLPFPGAP